MRELAMPWRVLPAQTGRVRLALRRDSLALLGPLYFLDLPLAGAVVPAGVPVVTVEAQNWVTDLPLPRGGRVVATNPALTGWVRPTTDPATWVLELTTAED